MIASVADVWTAYDKRGFNASAIRTVAAHTGNYVLSALSCVLFCYHYASFFTSLCETAGWDYDSIVWQGPSEQKLDNW